MTNHRQPASGRRHLAASLLCGCVILLAGCRSTQPGSMSHASVQVPRHPVAEIQQAATEVFRKAGYGLVAATDEMMVFDRPGTRRDALKWGGWSGNGVTMRVKVGVSLMLDGSQLLEADAYAVQNSDDEFFRTESRNVLLNRRPYQKLLNEVAGRLK